MLNSNGPYALYYDSLLISNGNLSLAISFSNYNSAGYQFHVAAGRGWTYQLSWQTLPARVDPTYFSLHGMEGATAADWVRFGVRSQVRSRKRKINKKRGSKPT